MFVVLLCDREIIIGHETQKGIIMETNEGTKNDKLGINV